MPTILRFRSLNIGIFLADHAPAHVHVVGGGKEAIYNLNCWNGPPAIRAGFGTDARDEKAISRFLMDNLGVLCQAWEAIHGDPTRA